MSLNLNIKIDQVLEKDILQDETISTVLKDFTSGYNVTQLKRLLSSTKDILTKGIQDNIGGKNVKIKLQSLNFLNELASIANTDSSVLQQLRGSSDHSLKKISNTIIASKNTSDSTIRLRLAYAAAFKFDAYLQNYLKTVPTKVIVVLSDSGESVPYEVDLSQMFLNASHGGSKNFGSLTWPESSNLSKEYKNLMIKHNQGEYAKHWQDVKDFYNQEIQGIRLEESRKKNTGTYLMWLNYKKKKKWTVGLVINKGVADEAFVTALYWHELQDKKDLKDLCEIQDVEKKVEAFYEYVAQVDSLRAIVAEDIVTATYQYAVKNQDAGLPSLNQYIQMAKIIATSDLSIINSSIKEKMSEWIDSFYFISKAREDITCAQKKQIDSGATIDFKNHTIIQGQK